MPSKNTKIDNRIVNEYGSTLLQIDYENAKEYAVIVKCGHCGDGYYIPVMFSISAPDIDTAIQCVKTYPKVQRDKKDAVLVWESSIATKNNILNTEYTNSSEETIDKIIRTNNSFEYRYYNLLVPTYVNINNQEDDTYDFIIVREINLYKTLEPLSYNINKYDTIIEDYRHEMNNLLYITILFSISITISLSISIIIGVLKTNNYIKYKFKFKKDGDK